jgi:peroxiredoxin
MEKSKSHSVQNLHSKPFMAHLIWLPFLALVILAVAGWWAWNSRHDAPSRGTVDVIGSRVGEIAPDFTVPTLEGDAFQLSEQGDRPTIIFFMAYWCPTCIPEARALAQLKEEYGDTLSIIALDIDPSSTPEALTNFKHVSGSGAFTWAFDAGQEVTRSYEVRSLDTTVIVDEEGRVVYRDGFVTPYETLKEALALIGY